MPLQALVCPHCRSWVEGEGRTIRCPSCGKRFKAADARLGANARAAEQPDFSRVETPRRVDAWDQPRSDRERDVWEREHEAEHERDAWHRWDETATEDPYRQQEAGENRPLGWNPEYDRHEEHSTGGDQSPEQKQQSKEESSEGGLGIVFTVALIVLFIFGRQFLPVEAFIGAIVALIGARWLYDRWREQQKHDQA